ncbi:MAG: AlpA family phage regulatory protein [Gammaproteobacteria bacterium]|nr:AlpA family phage regulatory protein [Gammaproteobacteria bacterium]
MNKQYLSDRQVASRYSIGRSTVWQWVKDGLLPAPIRFGQRCSRWDSDALDAQDEKMKE